MKKILNGIKNAVSYPIRAIRNRARSLNRTNDKKSWVSSILQSFKNKDIRNKVLYTLFIIAVFRLLAAITLPGIDTSLLESQSLNTPFNNLFTVITGGRLDNPSIVAIGLAPYINASVIIQLLTSVIPKLEQLQKEEGERGRQKLNQYGRILTLPLAIIQGFVIYTIVKNSPGLASLIANATTIDIVTMIATLTGGSILLMWLSELISENGIGNGSSMIISVGILSVLPGFISQDFQNLGSDIMLLLQGKFEVLWSDNLLLTYSVIVALLILIVVIVYMSEATRKITIQYARRVRGSATNIQNSFLPIKLNQAGVMPVIFASSMLIIPQVLAQFALSAASPGTWIYNAATSISQSFITNYSSFGYNLVDFLAIIAFTFFYTFVVLNPNNTADDLKKSGGFIPGIRPGGSTSRYLTEVMIRLSTVGALFLASISLAPTLIRGVFSSGALITAGSQFTLFSAIGGTSLLILVGVIIDTMRQIQSLNVTRSYEMYKD